MMLAATVAVGVLLSYNIGHRGVRHRIALTVAPELGLEPKNVTAPGGGVSMVQSRPETSRSATALRPERRCPGLTLEQVEHR